MHFTASSTPNPNAMKFTADQPLFTDRIEIIKSDTPASPILNGLIRTEGIVSLFGYHNFLTVCKTPDIAWDELLPQIENLLTEVSKPF
ncbi:NifU N-terminal domain-containing protein [Sporolactobacillus terrae]|uniref:Scaffolding protein n=1 Tax=Sporolactobacillus terrae TaxID=269673 RepID=A0A410D7V3_9BACL|nr:NifU N-terminal domain-containing protein [Sporolactobacillus terrae]QAA22150.1 scaffolding protein [Sporolactobacillus terrae]QAA25123.1 scaffolding protein [Sporolactobacillus terrae]UAK16941.1 NifU N-terminal domain-containing protein [Sporolactobacillus terrae]BBN98451.1 hypothetical protein St703_11560 [Sporolactobacillus terrae]